MSERWEHRFTMDLRSGRIVAPERWRDPPEERWRPIGEIDPVTGHSTVDLSKASGWRPIEEFWRW